MWKPEPEALRNTASHRWSIWYQATRGYNGKMYEEKSYLHLNVKQSATRCIAEVRFIQKPSKVSSQKKTIMFPSNYKRLKIQQLHVCIWPSCIGHYCKNL